MSYLSLRLQDYRKADPPTGCAFTILAYVRDPSGGRLRGLANIFQNLMAMAQPM